MYTPNNRILVIDDDKDLRDLLQQYLSRECFDVDCADGGAEMDIQLHEQRYDIIILDLMMPNEDGLSILRRIRPATRCPIIILSAKGQDTDKIIGLEVGADDYLAKPFNPRELLARIRALLRRHSTPQTAFSTELEPGKWPETRAKKPVVVFGQNTFNLQNHELLRNALPVKLTDSETHILTLFIKRRIKHSVATILSMHYMAVIATLLIEASTFTLRVCAKSSKMIRATQSIFAPFGPGATNSPLIMSAKRAKIAIRTESYSTTHFKTHI